MEKLLFVYDKHVDFVSVVRFLEKEYEVTPFELGMVELLNMAEIVTTLSRKISDGSFEFVKIDVDQSISGFLRGLIAEIDSVSLVK